METTVEQIWPEWQTIRKLGEGSFGKVYEAKRAKYGIEEHCAVKIISIPSSQAEMDSLRNEGMTVNDVTEYYRGLVEDFVQEIAVMSKLKGHVNIVGYEDYTVKEYQDRMGWDIVIRMELLTSLPAFMQAREKATGKVDAPIHEYYGEKDVIRMAIDICHALESCYEHQIVHRDIKPDNIFISSNGDYKLGDFGVARTVEKTISGLSKKGTYTYMAPEVYRGEPCTVNVDIYSLGIVMYKLLNDNREPFLPPHPAVVKYNDKSEALARRMNGGAFPPPARASAGLQAIVQKACAFRPMDRYATPTQMKNDLMALLNGKAPVAVATTPQQPTYAQDQTVAVRRTPPMQTANGYAQPQTVNPTYPAQPPVAGYPPAGGGYRPPMQNAVSPQENDYRLAHTIMSKAQTEANYYQAAQMFAALGNYKDSARLVQHCRQCGENLRKEALYYTAMRSMQAGRYGEALTTLQSIRGWRDSVTQITICEQRIAQAKQRYEESKKKKKKSKAPLVIVLLLLLVVGLAVAFFATEGELFNSFLTTPMSGTFGRWLC